MTDTNEKTQETATDQQKLQFVPSNAECGELSTACGEPAAQMGESSRKQEG